MELTTKQKAAFGIGAVGKDMVYALSASYVMYYYIRMCWACRPPLLA